MKKLFIIAAAACVTLASCVKNEPVATTDALEEISFESPVLAPNVKAVNEVGTQYENGQSFKVWAYSTADEIEDETVLTWGDADYIKNGVIAQSDGIWKGSPNAYYWPSTGYLHFMAIAPSSVEAAVDKSGITINNYEVTDGSVDLLYSERVLNMDANPVLIAFKHALASIDFTVSSSPITTYLKSIRIENVDNTGSFAQGLSATANSTTGAGDLWTEEEAYASNYVAFQADPEENNGYRAVTSSVDLTVGENQTSLILLPQELGANSQIVIEYHQGLPPTNSTQAKAETFPLNGSVWEDGVRYTYTITFGANEITFTPSSVEWGTAGVPVPSIQ